MRLPATAAVALAALVVAVLAVSACSPPPATAPREAAVLGDRATPGPIAPRASEPASAPQPRPRPHRRPQTAPARPPLPPAGHGVVVRSIGDLPDEASRRLRAVEGIGAVAHVRSGDVALTASRAGAGATPETPGDGRSIPLETIAVDPARFGPFVDGRNPLARLRPGRALLGATSARVRGLDRGARVTVGGVTLRIAGTVADRWVGSAELVAHPADADRVGLGGVRYLLAGARDRRARRAGLRAVDGIAAVLASPLPAGNWPPSWREVLPQAHVKRRFGEFALRPTSDRGIDQQPRWVRRNITQARVPLLGEVTCHRAIIAPLRAAMADLVARDLERLVDPGDYAGCYSPRLIGAGAPPSRHAWGIAVDLNASANPYGARPQQDRRLVAVMARHGFGFGGDWPVPDGMHFEYRGP